MGEIGRIIVNKMSTSPTKTPPSWPSLHAAQIAPLLALLALAAGLRLIFVNGVVFHDDFVYARAAHQVSRGVFPSPGWSGFTVRPGLYGPVALLYSLFGVSEVTSLAWPFFCSMLTVAFVYFIGRLQAGEAAGLLAAFLWSIFPVDIRMATSLLPDAPLAAFSSGAVLFFLLGEKWQGRHGFVAYVASLVCLAFASSIKLTVLLLLVFWAVYLVWRRRPDRRLWVFFATAVIIAGAVFVTCSLALGVRGQGPGYFLEKFGSTAFLDILAASATDWFGVMTHSRQFHTITPLFLTAIVVLLTTRRREAAVPLIWMGSMFLYFELGSQSPLSYVPVAPYMNRHILLVMVPFAVIGGIYLSQGLSVSQARGLAAGVAVAVGLIAWWGSRDAPGWSYWMIGQESSDTAFYALSAVCASIAIFGGIASPVFVLGHRARWKLVAIALLLMGVGLSTLNPTYLTVTDRRMPWKKNFKELLRFLETQPDYPVLVQSRPVALRLDYESGFRLGFASAPSSAAEGEARLRVAPDDVEQVGTAFVVIDDYFMTDNAKAPYGAGPAYFESPPATWWQVAQFGDYAPWRLRLYRVLSEDFGRALELARQAAEAAPNRENLLHLIEVASGAGDFCTVATAWQTLEALEPEAAASFDPKPALKHCYTNYPDVAGPNLLANGDFQKGLSRWHHRKEWPAVLQVGVDAEEGGPLLNIDYETGDHRAIYQTTKLQPDTFYVYEMTILSTAPVVVLYWGTTDDKITGHLDHDKTYPDWTRLIYVFRTPHYDGQPLDVVLYPIFLRGPGQVWLKDVRLSELQVGD